MNAKLSVAMYPASVSQDDNPFITILGDGLRFNGVVVQPFRPWLRTTNADALHIHWLEQIFWGRVSSRFAWVQKFLANGIVSAAERYRSAGKPVVWTVHNLRPHDGMTEARRTIFSSLVDSFIPLVTDCIVMDESTIELVKSEYPQLSESRFHLIPHPNFTATFEAFAPFPSARLNYNVSDSSTLLVSAGKIRAYKGLPELVRTLREVQADFTLIIAGDGDEREASSIKKEIGDDDRFIFDNRTIPAKEMAALLATSDAAVFNFTSILNSGSVLSALSVSTPVICPAVGAMIGLAKQMGAPWVQIHPHPLSPEFLNQSIIDVGHVRSSFCNLTDSAPRAVAFRHAEIYRSSRHADA